MLTNKKLATSALIASALFCTSSQATELSLKEYASAMIAHAVETTVDEIRLAVHTDILNAAHSFELEPSTMLTRVTITDIETEDEEEEKSE
jgi:hypothetical protein